MGQGKRTRLPADKGFTGWTCELREVPPPSGAQMTRRMACTQSSISRWELAMSRSASGLAGTFSRSAAPPARQGDRAYFRVPMQDSTAGPLLAPRSSVLVSGLHPVSSHGDTLWCFFSPLSSCQFAFMCSFVPISKQKIIKSITGHHEGNTPILGQLEVQFQLQLPRVLLKSDTHCVYYSLCALPLV